MSIELSTALFEYLEIFHNRNRRHSSLGMLTSTEDEKVNNQTAAAVTPLTSAGHLVGVRPSRDR